MRVIDTWEYVSALREVTESGQEAGMRIWGSSMAPFLVHGRDWIYFSRPARPLKKGDMVFYQRTDRQYVMHRICRISGGGYYLVGDAQTRVEGPIAEGQIFALVTRVKRKGKELSQGSFCWDFFAGPWLLLRPMRPVILRLYAGIRHREK